MLTKMNSKTLLLATLIQLLIVENSLANKTTTINAVDKTKDMGSVTLFDSSKKPREQFRFNNWKGKAKCVETPCFTPIGSPAWKFTITEKEPPTALHLNLFLSKNGEWRNDLYNTVSFWFKGDGTTKKIRLSFDNGKHFTKHLSLTNDKWEKIRLSLTTDPKIWTPSQVKVLSLKINTSCEFRIGNIELEAGKRNVNLKPCAMTIAPLIKADESEEFFAEAFAGKNNNALSQFYKIKSWNEKPEMDTKVWLAHDQEKLYIASKLFYDDVSKAVGTMTQKDVPVWQEDDFEILFDSNNDLMTYFHVALGIAGGSFDMKYDYDIDLCLYARSIKWTADLFSDIIKTNESIDLKIVLPLKEINFDPNKHPYMGMQLGRTNYSNCVTKVGVKNNGEYSSWSPTNKIPHIKQYGALVLGREKNCTVKISDVKLSEISTGEFVLDCFIENENSDKNVSVKAAFITPPNVRYEFKWNMPLRKGMNECRRRMRLTPPQEGDYRFVLCVQEGADITPAVSIYSFDLVVPLNVEFGEPTLTPQPKKILWKKRHFEFSKEMNILIPKGIGDRTMKTAEFLKQEFYDHTGIKGNIKEIETKHVSKPVIWLTRPKSEINPETIYPEESLQGMKAEGYILDITPEILVLAGQDEAGLYYSVVTLCQLLRAPKIREQENSIPCITINDWPDLATRCNVFFIGGLCRSQKLAKFMNDNPRKKLDFFKHYVKRFIAGNKMNSLSFTPHAVYKWEKHPELSHNSFLDKNDLREIADYCRDNFVEFVPGLNLASHDGYFLHRAHPELREKGFNQMVDMTHPLYKQILKDCLQELIDACSPKYIDIAHDELWHRRVSGEVPDENKKSKKDILYEDLMLHYNFLKERGVGMAMYGDMLIKEHHGDRFDCYTVAEKLPKDIIIHNWSARSILNSSKILKDVGFENVCDTPNGFGDTPQNRGISQGFGTITYGPFVLTTQSFTSDVHALSFSYQGLCRAADYAWNFMVDDNTPLHEWRRQKLLNLLPIYSFKPNPAASSDFLPIDLTNVANETLNDPVAGDGEGWFDAGNEYSCVGIDKNTNEIGKVPVKIPDGKKVVLLSEKNQKVELPINEKLSSLIILQTCEYPRATKQEKQKFRDRMRDYTISGVPICKYEFVYGDGSKAETFARFGTNILEWTPYAAARFLPDCRYIWQTKLNNGKLGCLYQYEWVNPFPNKTIKKIVMEKENTEANVAIVALTGRKVKKS